MIQFTETDFRPLEQFSVKTLEKGRQGCRGISEFLLRITFYVSRFTHQLYAI